MCDYYRVTVYRKNGRKSKFAFLRKEDAYRYYDRHKNDYPIIVEFVKGK